MRSYDGAVLMLRAFSRLLPGIHGAPRPSLAGRTAAATDCWVESLDGEGMLHPISTSAHGVMQVYPPLTISDRKIAGLFRPGLSLGR